MAEIMDLLVMGLGAGAKGALAGWVAKIAPALSEDVAAGLAGGLMYYFGDRIHPLVKKFGAGVLIAAIGQYTAGITAALAPAPAEGGGGGGHHSPSPQPVITLEQLARMEAGG